MFRRRVSDNPTREQWQEYLKLLYDLTKHSTTLCTATTVVLVALSRDDPSRLYVPLGILLVAIAFALMSMHRILGLVAGVHADEREGWVLNWLYRGIFVALFTAVAWYTFSVQLLNLVSRLLFED